MFEPIVWGTFLGRDLYAYGLWIAVAGGVCLALMEAYIRRQGLAKGTAWTVGMLAIPLCVVCGHAFYCLIRAAHLFPLNDLGLFLRPWEGGFGLGGVLLGGALSVWLASRLTRQPSARVMDTAAPFAAFMIALCRFGEWLDGAGFGDYIENEALHFFPFAIENAYGEFFFALFIVEGIVGIAICFALLLMRRRNPSLPEGTIAYSFLLMFGGSQIILESLRRDQYLRFGFVRVGQLAALCMIVLVIAVFGRKARRKGAGMRRLSLDWALALLCAGVGVAMEFAFEKSHLPNWAGYVIMSGAVALMVSRGARLMHYCMKGRNQIAEEMDGALASAAPGGGQRPGAGSAGDHCGL